MESAEFKIVRAKLMKTQKAVAQLLGISIKAIHSYEQGWRRIPHHVERQLLFLLYRSVQCEGKEQAKCWEIQHCPDTCLKECPAWEFNSGDLCWFVNGTKCNGKIHNSWDDKMEECRTCPVFQSFFKT